MKPFGLGVIILVLLSGAGSGEAHASIRRAHPVFGEDLSKQMKEEDFSVPIPRSELAPMEYRRAPEASLIPVQLFRSDAPARLEAFASSWVPNSLSTESRFSNVSSFQGGSVPQVAVSFLSAPLTRWRRASVSLLAGAAFVSLSRVGMGPTSPIAVPKQERQDMYVVPVRLGIEGAYPLPGPWSVYSDLALAPTIGVSSRTVFDDGRAVFGIPLEISAGAANDLRWLTSSLQGIQLKAAGVWTVGNVASADFSGKGIKAGLSFPL